MYLPSSGDGMDTVSSVRDLRHPIPSFFFCPIRNVDTVILPFSPLILLLPLPSSDKPPLKLPRSRSAEVVPAPDHVGPVRVMRRVERCEQGEHLGRVAAAAEDDEKVRWGAAFTRSGWAVVEGGEDVD